MMTHTTYLTGAGANDTLPSNSQGFGMPNLEMAFDNTKRYLLDESVVLDNSGDAWTFHGSVDDPTRPVRVSMVYTDAPGAVGTSPQVNNLDLSVAVNSTTYLGNVFSGQYSVTGGSPDNADNYEAVFLPAGTAGGLSITVTGFNIAGDGVPNRGDGTDQDFAIVCYNCNQCSGTVTLNRSVYDCRDTIGITLADYDLVGAGSQNVTIRSTTEPGPETVTLDEIPPDSGVFVGTLRTFSGPPASGDGRISVANDDTITVRYVDAFHCGDPDVALEQTAAADCVGPVISNVQAVNVTGNRADITWTTDEPASSSVTYDTITPPHAGNASRPQLVASHTVTVTGLVPCTQYYYYVGSTDAAGNSSTDAPGGTYDTFTTGVNSMPTYDSTDVPKTIADNSTVTSTLAVVDNKTITDLNVNIGNITHTYDGDLEISIIGPDGTTVILSNTRGSNGDNYVNTVFDDEAATPVSAGTAPFTGPFRPDQALTVFDGKDAIGTWTLRIRDLMSLDTGALNGWGLTFTYPPRQCNSPGPIIFQSASHADTCNGPGGGESNGYVEPGEDVVVQVTARNDGTAQVTNVTGTLSTTTPGITITDNTATFPNMLSSQSGTSSPNHFSYLVGPGMPCRTSIDFNIAFTSNQGSWNGSFTKAVGGTGTVPGPPTTYGSTDVPKTIADNSTVTSNSPAAADTQPVADVDVTIGSITHPYDGDLTLTLIHPDGTRATLSNRRGSSGDNFTNTVFDDEAATPISSGTAPFTGSWKPDIPLSGMDNKPANGVWKLEVSNYSNIDPGMLNSRSMTPRTGTLNNWSMTLRTLPLICNACLAANPPAEASNLRWTAGSKDQLDWNAAAGATSYNMYRGDAAGLPSLLNSNTDSCTRTTTTAASSGHILMEPSPSSPVLYWYVVTGVNGVGEGPAGTATAGTRIVNSSGPCP
jgi:subtilisin-like proprotein convertase family protein